MFKFFNSSFNFMLNGMIEGNATIFTDLCDYIDRFTFRIRFEEIDCIVYLNVGVAHWMYIVDVLGGTFNLLTNSFVKVLNKFLNLRRDHLF